MLSGPRPLRSRQVGLTKRTAYGSHKLHPTARDSHAVSDEDSINAPPISASSSDGRQSESDGSSSLKRRKVAEPETGSASSLAMRSRSSGQRIDVEDESDVAEFVGQAGRKKSRVQYSKRPANTGGNIHAAQPSSRSPSQKKKTAVTAQKSNKGMKGEHIRAPGRATRSRNNVSDNCIASKTGQFDSSMVRLMDKAEKEPESFQFRDPLVISAQTAAAGPEFRQPLGLKSLAKNENKAVHSVIMNPKKRENYGPKTRSRTAADAASDFREPLRAEAIAEQCGLLDEINNIREGCRQSPVVLDEADVESVSSLSSVSSVSTPPATIDEPASSNTSLSTATHISSNARCPLCSSIVPSDLLTTFKSRLRNPSVARLSVQQQAAFHRRHLTVAAQNLWHERHYPTIDWYALPSRFETFRVHMLSVLDGRNPSFYRDRLRNNTAGTSRGERSVANRLAAGQDGAENVGYYGGQGQRVFADWLITAFSMRIRELQGGHQDLLAAGGVAAFVQEVLVPELAHKLILEDLQQHPEMGVGVRERALERRKRMEKEIRGKAEKEGLSEEEVGGRMRALGIDWGSFDAKGEDAREWLARWVAEESADVGRLINEEEDDVVVAQEEEDEGEE